MRAARKAAEEGRAPKAPYTPGAKAPTPEPAAPGVPRRSHAEMEMDRAIAEALAKEASDRAKAFIRRLLCHCEQSRMGAGPSGGAEVLEHTWLKQ